MDRVVVTMSSYRKLKKPLEDKDEEEFLMELCNVLSVCCMEAAGKQQFLDFEGIELMFIILRNRQMFRIGCVKVCDPCQHFSLTVYTASVGMPSRSPWLSPHSIDLFCRIGKLFMCLCVW